MMIPLTFLHQSVEMCPTSDITGLARIGVPMGKYHFFFLEPKLTISTPLVLILALQQDVKTMYVHMTGFKYLLVLLKRNIVGLTYQVPSSVQGTQ